LQKKRISGAFGKVARPFEEEAEGEEDIGRMSMNGMPF